MFRLCKVVIGVLPAKRMFRITSLSGEVLDALIESVGSKSLPDDYFTRVGRSPDGSNIRLRDAKNINNLSVDTQNIVFTKDHYEQGGRIDFEDIQREFQQIWEACQAVLKVKNIRRIGMVGEYRLSPPSANPSTALLNHVTKLDAKGHVAKFQMQFETRTLTTGESGFPDLQTSDFWNTIETYYDSEMDAEHSEEGQITAMLDVQRYYAPFLNGNVPDEVRRLKKRFDDATSQTKLKLGKLGLLYAAETKSA